MKPGGKKRRRWRIIRRLVFVFLFGLIALWGTVNLFFSISWGTDLIAERIEKRLGLPCELESVTWTPWGGVRVKDFVMKPDNDSGFSGEILRVDTVTVDLSWFSLVQRKKRFERMEISGVTGEVSIEFLKSLLKKNAVSSAQEPRIVDSDPEESSPTSPSEAAPSKEDEQSEAVSQQEGPKENPNLPVTPVDDFEGVIVFEDVNIALTSLEHPELSLAVENLEGEVPVWGVEREGYFGFAALHARGQMVLGKEEIPVKWKEQFIRIDDHDLKVAGLDLKMNLAIRVSQGLPVGLQVVAPKQQIDFSSIFGEKKSPISIKTICL